MKASRVCLVLMLLLDAACSTWSVTKVLWSATYQVSDHHVVVSAVSTEWAKDTKEYEAALFWYKYAFELALNNSTVDEVHLELWHFKKGSVGRAAEVGYYHGEADAAAYLHQLPNKASTGS